MPDIGDVYTKMQGGEESIENRFWMISLVSLIMTGLIGLSTCAFLFHIGNQSNEWKPHYGEIMETFPSGTTVEFGLGMLLDREELKLFFPVFYQYLNGSEKHYSRLVRFGLFSSSDLPDTETYKPGTQVTVYFSEDNPALSVLEPGLSNQSKFALYFLMLFFSLIMGFGIWGMVQWQYKQPEALRTIQ